MQLRSQIISTEQMKTIDSAVAPDGPIGLNGRNAKAIVKMTKERHSARRKE